MAKSGAALRAAGWVTVGVIAAGGVATAATTSSSTSKAASTTAGTSAGAPAATGKHKGGKLGMLRGHLLHGQATVAGKDGKPTQVAGQRGTVEAVSATSITLKSSDGFQQTYVVAPTTKVRIDGTKSTISDVKTGQSAGVIATVSGSTQTAKGIVERAAK